MGETPNELRLQVFRMKKSEGFTQAMDGILRFRLEVKEIHDDYEHTGIITSVITSASLSIQGAIVRPIDCPTTVFFPGMSDLPSSVSKVQGKYTVPTKRFFARYGHILPI